MKRSSLDSIEKQNVLNSAKRTRLTQEERREASEQRILEAALELVAEKGSIRVTLAEIGEKAGYSRGLPAHRFGSKNKLLAALGQFIYERFAQHRKIFYSEPGLKSLEATIRAYFTREETNWMATRALIVIMAESALVPSELKESMAKYNRQSIASLTRQVCIAQELGEIRSNIDAETLAIVILANMRGAMLQWLNDPSMKLEKIRDEVLMMLHHHIVDK